MKQNANWLLTSLLALALAGAAQASPPGRCGPPCRRGDAPDCPPDCAEQAAPRERGERPTFAPPPRQSPELREAHHAAMKLARQAREAEGEERDRLVAELREQVLRETRLVDRLQEERLDAIEKAAQERVAAMRAELQKMRENQDAFVDSQVERYLQGPAACRGKFAPPEDGPDGFGPPPEGEDGPAFDGHRPPRPHHPRFGHGPRGPRCGSPCPQPPPPCATSPEGGPLPDAPLGIPAPAVEPPPAEIPAD